MKDQLIEPIVSVASRSLKSGNVRVSLDRKPLIEIKFGDRFAGITLNDRDNVRRIYHTIPKSDERFSTVKRIANILKNHGYLLEIRTDKALLLELGRGVHSITGDLKVKLLEMRKYLKKQD
ncbi:MAG: hypothetical protein AAE977_07010 [Thermoplasmataceae archaeon]|jgi:hypothetical protein